MCLLFHTLNRNRSYEYWKLIDFIANGTLELNFIKKSDHDMNNRENGVETEERKVFQHNRQGEARRGETKRSEEGGAGQS